MSERALVGDRRLVFDAQEWGGRDVGDNSQFWHPATLWAVAYEPTRNARGFREQIASVTFDHDGHVSHGHFVSCMRPLGHGETL